jgi:hypothetical protein
MFLFAWILNSCAKIDSLNNEKRTTNKADSCTIEQSAYNLDVQNFAKAVNELVKSNISFRNIIHKEALKQRDGDYDVLVSDVVNLTLSGVGTKGSVSDMSVKDALEQALRKVSTNTGGLAYGSDSKSSSNNPHTLVEDLMTKYPNLQVSVPVHIEDMNDSNYVPPVTFVTEEALNGNAGRLIAYSGDNVMSLDINEEPDSAVIVVGMNERTEDVSSNIDIISQPVLAASLTESGIRLTWTFASLGVDIAGYNIYRKSSSDPAPIKIASLSATSAKLYDDNTITASMTYTYYISAYNYVSEIYSNMVTITAPNMPNPVTSFGAILRSTNEVEFNWENNNTQYVSSTNIYKRVWGRDNNYILFNQFTPNQNYGYDRSISSGEKVYYRIAHVNNIGESDSKFDFVYVPYRDITKKTNVNLYKISYSWRTTVNGRQEAIENWFQGLPEFEIKVLTVDANGKAVEANSIIVSASSRESFYCDKILYQWLPAGFKWYDVLSISVMERDFNQITVNLSAQTLVKFTAGPVDLQSSLTATIPVTFGKKGDDIGQSYYSYYEPTSSVISYNPFDVKLYVR